MGKGERKAEIPNGQKHSKDQKEGAINEGKKGILKEIQEEIKREKEKSQNNPGDGRPNGNTQFLEANRTKRKENLPMLTEEFSIKEEINGESPKRKKSFGEEKPRTPSKKNQKYQKHEKENRNFLSIQVNDHAENQNEQFESLHLEEFDENKGVQNYKNLRLFSELSESQVSEQLSPMAISQKRVHINIQTGFSKGTH